MRETSSSWQKILANGFKSVHELLAYLDLPLTLGDLHAQDSFKTRVPLSFAERMEKGNPQDPLLLQVLAQQAENLSVPAYEKDPLQELNSTPTPGLIHKYHGRVLITLAGACAIHCRYCFRRHFPYHANQASADKFQGIMNYIQQDSSLHEIILSGGDPLLYNDFKLREVIELLENIAHVKTIRIHTRIPIVLPERITPELLRLFTKSRCHVVMVVHSNHANELSEQIKQTCFRIKKTGIHLLNQSVLLKNINNQADTLIQLSHRLFDCGILPYYLHLLDPVIGSAHFNVSLEEGMELFEALQINLPGYLVPRLVKEQAGCLHKSSIHQLTSL